MHIIVLCLISLLETLVKVFCLRVVHNTIYWGGYHHQSAEDVELSQADVVDVAAAKGARLNPLKQQIFVVVAEALKPVGSGGTQNLE